MKSARRGEVWLVDYGMAAKVRPSVIFSASFADDERALYAAVQHTTSTRGGRYEVPLPVRFLAPGAFDVQGLGPIRPTQLIRRLGILTDEQMETLAAAVKRWLVLR
jgi:mRNA interferase MazF